MTRVIQAAREKLLRYIEEICYHTPKSCGQCGLPNASCDDDCEEHAAAMAEVAVVKEIVKELDALDRAEAASASDVCECGHGKDEHNADGTCMYCYRHGKCSKFRPKQKSGE